MAAYKNNYSPEMKTDAYSQVRRGAGRITDKYSAFGCVVNGK